MIFNKKYKTIFLDPNSDIETLDGRVNIILSPSLYWVKKMILPVNSVREVKKLLPSIFEETLPDGKYSYSAYEGSTGSEFFVFAYEDKNILDVIAKKNISIAEVVNVYFAQSELLSIDGAVKINESQSIYIKDDILVLVPCCWVEEKGELDLSSVVLSKHKVSLQQFGHIVDIKNFYNIGAVLVVLILIVFSELFITAQKADNILELKDELFSKNGLQPTMFQNTAMLKKYKAIHMKQTSIRKYISYLLSLKLKQNEYITLISLKERVMVVNFSGTKEKAFSHITSSLEAKNVMFKSTYVNGVLHLEIAL
ncbi:hypothetical protein HUE87_08395 [Candidatus Sulfurimonas marisnigri]|uniref:Uncharacterized protein n=1 Tax=Candidatus Sulfurimonas marisnigri TaxID=2740405 RepID=A0A7S7LZT3_9BACT|nr:hypothetical protein [Candidatus Sulfurimonas marisnigri]QOY53913.1 hypothetical protein HUE87_08395 [Candidatus Sulfurimonas marisnigri]